MKRVGILLVLVLGLIVAGCASSDTLGPDQVALNRTDLILTYADFRIFLQTFTPVFAKACAEGKLDAQACGELSVWKTRAEQVLEGMRTAATRMASTSGEDFQRQMREVLSVLVTIAKTAAK